MKIECSNDVLSAGDKRIQIKILREYNRLISKRTDVAVPFYKLEAGRFEKIWHGNKINNEECDFWRNILHKRDDFNRRRDHSFDINPNELCFGELKSECSIVFLDDVQYIKWSGIEFIESPGIYIKSPLTYDKYLCDFMVAYSMHLAETYYLSNRIVTTEKFKSKDIEYFRSFIVSLLTIRSLHQINNRIVEELVFHHSDYLVGSWKIPFLILKQVPEDKWNYILNNDEIVGAIEDMLSGSPLGRINIRIRRIFDTLLY